MEDPYIWLEEVEAKKSIDWVKKQNTLSVKKITAVEGFDKLNAKLLKTFDDKDKIAYPSTVGEYVYNTWKDENHIRGIWRRTKKEDYLKQNNKWETILDIDALSKKEAKKWVFKGANFLETDKNICLLTLSDGGTDKSYVREFNIKKKEFVKNGFSLPPSKGGASWISKDELLISRDFGEGSLTESGYPRIVKRLKRGMKLSEAKTIMEGKTSLVGLWGYTNFINGQYRVFLSEAHSFYKSDTHILHDGKLVKLNIPEDANFNGVFQGQMILKLNSDWNVKGENFKIGSLVSLDFEKLLAGSLDVQLCFEPNSKSSLSGTSFTKDALIVNTLQNVQSVLLKAEYKNKKWNLEPIDAPKFGTISVVDSDKESNSYFYRYNNFITPSTLYHSESGKTKIVKSSKQHFNSKNLEVHQYETKSKDGTTIPYFIVHKKDLKLNGKNPTLVYAYGGFNVSSLPRYSSTVGIAWLEQGGVYVLANIRGGGEFGPSWHQAALKEKRQNAYDDFYAVCEDLNKRKISSQKHLGAYGWSNGGLMAGVVATQRPDLFNAVIIGAPLLDMKRFNKMLAGASWMGEYGNPDIPEQWDYIKKYSPYHNVFKGKEYPEVLLVTSTKDDRVHPAHARKMAARMLEQKHPIFYYETIEGGHGATSTNKQSAFLSTLMYSYLKMKLF
jgi:prolyl oligopeptidase